MDTYVIAAIITAVSTVLTCIISTIFRPKDSAGNHQRRISEKQLLHLLAPLEQLLVYSSYRDIDALIPRIQSVIDSNFVYVPSLLWDKFMHLCEAPSTKRFADFTVVVSSLYNHSRKKLGYPHDKNSIIRKYTPFPERYAILSFILRLAIVSIFPIFVFISTFFLTKEIPVEIEAATHMDMILIISVVIFSTFLLHLIFQLRRK